MDLFIFFSYLSVILAIISALFISLDVLKHPQPMKIMNVVWPINALYLGPFGIWIYWKLGRPKAFSGHNNHHGHGHHHSDDKPFWQSVFVSTTHCSSGCVIGDIIGAPLVFYTGMTIAGSMLFADYLVEFILAFIFGIGFQLLAIMPMNDDLSWSKGTWLALKADTLSLIAFEIGMFGWMAIVHLGYLQIMPHPNEITFWFMMQIAMVLGTLTSYPANWFLVKAGVKHSM